MIIFLAALLTGCLGIYYFVYLKKISLEVISNIEGLSVFITGCDTGFGRLLALHLDELGVKVYAGCLLSGSMASLKEESSSKLTPVLIDIANAESVRNAADVVKQDLEGSGLWGLVNNAGITGATAPIELLSKSSFEKTINVNLLGTIDVTLAFIPLLKKSKRTGRIVNMSSIYGRLAFLSGGYILSKQALEAFSDGLRFEYDPTMFSCLQNNVNSWDLEPYGITTHTINPFFYKTPLITPSKIKKIYHEMWEIVPRETRQQYGEDFLNKFLSFKLRTMNDEASSNLYEVIDAYTHALLSKYPQNRYIIGNVSKFVYIPISYLPVLWQIKVIKLILYLKGNPIPRPKAAGIQ